MFALLSWRQHNFRDVEGVYLKQGRRCLVVLASYSRQHTVFLPDLSPPGGGEVHDVTHVVFLFSPPVKLCEIRICLYANMYWLSTRLPLLQNTCILLLSEWCYIVLRVTYIAGSQGFILCIWNFFFFSVALNHFFLVPGAWGLEVLYYFCIFILLPFCCSPPNASLID